MRTALRSAETEAEIWTGIMYPEGNMSRQGAAAILGLSFGTEHRRRMRELSAKARAGGLTPEEEFEMQNFERVSDLLSFLKSKARRISQNNDS